MPTTQQVSDIVNKVKQRLEEAEGEGIHLKVQNSKLDDDWLYIVVVPSKANVAHPIMRISCRRLSANFGRQGKTMCCWCRR